MWVCLNKSFVSIVEDFADENRVYVRGRRIEDVHNFVGDGHMIKKSPNNDYLYRANITKAELGNMLVKHANSIDYGNFKDSVKDKDLSMFYTEVWNSGVNNLEPNFFDRLYGKIDPVINYRVDRWGRR